jgi:protein-tyrosine phosphatase
VLAHPERNEVLQQRPSLARAWVQSGAALQLDGDSLLGVWGRHTKHCAERILRDGLFHAMASDAHSTDRRPPRLAEALERARQLVGDGAEKLVTDGPEALLDGRMPETPLYEVEAGSGSSRRSGLISRLLNRRHG